MKMGMRTPLKTSGMFLRMAAIWSGGRFAISRGIFEGSEGPPGRARPEGAGVGSVDMLLGGEDTSTGGGGGAWRGQCGRNIFDGLEYLEIERD
jgi:hypothetical protein